MKFKAQTELNVLIHISKKC